MTRTVLVVLLASMGFAACGAAPAAEDLAGIWVWSLEGRSALVFTLSRGAKGLEGTLQRPLSLEMGNAGAGLAVKVKPPFATVKVSQVRETAEGVVLRVAGASADNVEEIVLDRGSAPGTALLRFAGAGPGPVAYLTRPGDPTKIAPDFDPDRAYLAAAPAENGNPELSSIFAADQADRQAGPNIDWAVVAPKDVARRRRVRELIDQGLVRSGSDLYYAAFVFQHGDRPEDYLMAHVLAMAAQARGRPDAGWISAATLDRFLDSIGRKQVLGTQFEPGGKALKPMDLELVPPSIRAALGITSLQLPSPPQR